ncbi:right-handed parallel beta-helix repeat-containing protein [Paraglaciecola sp.]|uniref:PKD domain-containing protein n=3 Tax=Paraglaciecola sp. TaxID=1920173 RepID=UPI003266475E
MMGISWQIKKRALVLPFLLFFAFGASAQPEAIATFESIGVYWSDAVDAGSENEGTIQYRPLGDSDWNDGFALWYDERGGDFGEAEYRGSLVNLTPNTEYEIKVTLESGTSEIITAITWSEEFPVASIVELPESSDTQLTIKDSGSEGGYLVYTYGESGTAEITGGTYNIKIDASYIIIRGLTLTGAEKHAIYLDVNAHHVIIEDNDISQWGRVLDDGFAKNFDSGVFSKATLGAQFIIQRNKIHHPNYDSNNWEEYRVATDTYHPEGAQAISFENTAGNHVIRYNEIYSDEDHYFNDGIGGLENYSYNGSPNRDSDIYGNYISHCWDDGIEAEGANRNVRIWGNYITKTFVGIATAGTSIGPLYIWRNIYGISQESDLSGWDSTRRGGFIKTQNKESYTGGKMFVFHNTILQPTIEEASETVGPYTGLGWGGNMDNVMSRNNILTVQNSETPSINGQVGDNGDYDYDLYNGRIDGEETSQENGIKGSPTYYAVPDYSKVLTTGVGIFVLGKESLGYDSGVKIANFNDNFQGDAPDIGAHEVGTAPMEFGVNAYEVSSSINSAPEASVGEDKVIVQGEEVELQVAASDEEDSEVSISWDQLTGKSVEIFNAESDTPTFIAPEVDENSELLIFSVRVSDSEGLSVSESIEVTVTAETTDSESDTIDPEPTDSESDTTDPEPTDSESDNTDPEPTDSESDTTDPEPTDSESGTTDPEPTDSESGTTDPEPTDSESDTTDPVPADSEVIEEKPEAPTVAAPASPGPVVPETEDEDTVEEETIEEEAVEEEAVEEEEVTPEATVIPEQATTSSESAGGSFNVVTLLFLLMLTSRLFISQRVFKKLV